MTKAIDIATARNIPDELKPKTAEDVIRNSAIIQGIFEYIKNKPNDWHAYDDFLTICQDRLGKGQMLYNGWNGVNKAVRQKLVQVSNKMAEGYKWAEIGRLNEAYRKSLWLDSRVDFDAFALYIEQDRDPSKRFYQPRRSVLGPIAKDLMELDNGDLDLLCISLPPGCGKSLANETPILTRNGWKNHGDLVVGDEVIGMDGKFKKVIAVHPKCQMDRIVTFSNGETFMCHHRHEWMIYDRVHAYKGYQTLETQVIEQLELETGGEPGHRGHRYHIQLPKRCYVVGEEKDLPLDPYALGVWLGDGDNTAPRICCDQADAAVVDRIVEHGWPVRNTIVHKQYNTVYFCFGFRSALQEMGMCNSRHRTTKHIPDIYLTASIEQRLQLLAGLMDTDGTLSGKKYQFSNTEPELIDGVCALVSTFGWRTCVTQEAPSVSSSGIHGRKTVYTVSFTPDLVIPCAIPRKRNDVTGKQRAISMVSIKPLDEPVEGNCITVEGDGMYLAGKTMLPTHNTTLAIFYLSWIGGRYPNMQDLTFSHDASIIRGMYDEVLRIVGPDGEYLWRDVFPGVDIAKTNAKDMRIDLGEDKRFETFQFSSVGAGNAGKLRASKLLYCDDLIESIEQAMSKERLDKLWNQYATDILQRGTGDFRQLHIATRWSVHDVIGRLERAEQENPTGRAKFIVIPALNENDESNFDYPGIHDKFTTERYHALRETMDDVNWRALYMNEPIEREGLLYSEDELSRFFELPDGTPEAIISVCDTKDKGSDYCCMPIAYQYGNYFYIVDVVDDNSAPDVVEPQLVSKCLEHSIQLSRFESNSAGGKVAEKVQNQIKEAGGKTAIQTMFTTANKETRIIMASPYVKQHFLFRDGSTIKGPQWQQYRHFIRAITSWTMTIRNKHDDEVDALAMLSEFIQSFEAQKPEFFKRPY
ncbi:MAG: phage terminase large subunit [Clostridium sp.]|nr:phage terminase large subunit [Clostridium sp.]